MAKLVIKGSNSKSRLWLARRMAERLAAALPGRQVRVTADSAYAGGELKGKRLASLAGLAAAAEFSQFTVIRYRKTETIEAAAVTCLWYSVFGSRPVTVVLVRDRPGRGFGIAQVTTETAATMAQVIERYASRWSIEVAIEDSKQLFGAGQARNRTASGGTCRLPTVLGSSDVPKYTGSTDLKNESTLYYLSFAPAKKSYCGTSGAHPYQTPAMCNFLGAYRAQYHYTSTSDAGNNPVLTYDSSDAMLGDDALQTVIPAIDAADGNPGGINGADILREFDSGKISFNGASGLISFSAQQHTSFDHPVYVTLLGQTLTVKISCGQYSNNSRTGTDPACPTSRS